MRTLLFSLLLSAASLQAAWPVTVEALMAADAASYAPPDLKRQLAKHRDRLMAGVKDAAAAETGERDAAAHRAAAVRGARALVKAIRQHVPFEKVAYEFGGVVHELAAASAPKGIDGASAVAAAKSSAFLGYPARPFAEPEMLATFPATASPRAAYDTSVTAATRLLAWIWKTSGGDASVTTKYPESEGPYVVR